MDHKEIFDRAIKETRIHRRRKSNLYTFGTTRLNYIFAADSSINPNDVIIRSGEVHADKPQIIMPGASGAHFEGFDEMCEKMGIDSDEMQMVLMTRHISFPNMNYTNNQSSLEVVEGPLERVIEQQIKKLDAREDTRTAFITGPEATAALSIMVYVSEMIQSSAQGNISELMEHHRF